jgi:hypothetical protein
MINELDALKITQAVVDESRYVRAIDSEWAQNYEDEEHVRLKSVF